MQKKRDFFLERLKETPFTIDSPAEGSYFQIARYNNISDLPDMEFARWLVAACGVAVIPVSAFYASRQDDKVVRLCFAKREEVLEKAIGRLQNQELLTLKSV